MANIDEHIEEWISGIPSEISFWRTWVRDQGGQWKNEFQQRTSGNFQFNLPAALRFVSNGAVRILDAGSGPISNIGTFCEGVKIELVACDPLANFYEEILKEFEIRPPVITEFAFVEDLESCYSTNSFDVAHVRNALDHSFSPLIGIKSLLSVVRPMGCVILIHYENEAEHEHYSGFHKWNFSTNDGRFIIWNKENKIDVGLELGVACDVHVEKRHGESRDVIYVEIIKLREVSSKPNSFKRFLDRSLLRMAVDKYQS